MTRVTGSIMIGVTGSILLLACSDTTAPVPSTLVLSPDSAGLMVGGEQHVTAIVRDAAGAVITDATVAYRSTDTTIARVTPGGHVAVGGHVSALGAGRALIIGTSGTAADTVIIEVMP